MCCTGAILRSTLHHFKSEYGTTQHACASSLDVDFTTLYRKIQHQKSFCDAAATKENCHCQSPLIHQARVKDTPEYWKQWDATFARNKELAAHATSPDVVMVGDSITEHWVGTDLGEFTPEAMSVERVFTTLFVNGDVHGLALGIAGDRCPQLLYRLKSGEMPDSLQPRVWWILIGTNDLTDYCSQEAILAGTIGIVMEIRRKRPNAIIVINGILPRPGNPMGVLDAGLHFWRKISWINDRMSCYADGLARVEFFNASDLFLTSDGIVDQSVMPDYLHPNDLGASRWGKAIVQTLKELLAQNESK